MKLKILIFCLFLPHLALAEVVKVNNSEIIELMKKGVPIVDIRKANEWADTGVIDSSILLTFFDKDGKYNFDLWLSTLDKLIDVDKPFIIICRSGRRSGNVSKYLDEQLNHDRVYDATNGMASWINSKNKTVKPN